MGSRRRRFRVAPLRVLAGCRRVGASGSRRWRDRFPAREIRARPQGPGLGRAPVGHPRRRQRQQHRPGQDHSEVVDGLNRPPRCATLPLVRLNLRIFAWLIRRSLFAAIDDGSFSTAKGAAYSALLSFFPVLASSAAILVQTRTEFVSRTIENLVSEIVPPGTEDLVERFRKRGFQ